jgi:small subunit ribosomal protein S16
LRPQECDPTLIKILAPIHIFRRIVAVKIRLKRIGKKKDPHYRIVVADSRTHRDGKVIEEIGRYVPTTHPSVIEINSERARYWLSVGAQPTEQAEVLLKLTGDIANAKGEHINTVKPQIAKPVFVNDMAKKSVLLPKTEKKVEVVAEAKVEALAVETPAVETPAVETPAVETPAAEVAEAPVVEAVVAAEVAEAPAAEAVIEAPVAEAAVEAPAEVVAEVLAEEAPAAAEETPAAEAAPETPAEEAKA